MINFVPENDNVLFVEVIFEKAHKFTTTLTATNTGYVRFVSKNLEKENLIGVAVVFCDGFIKNYKREKIKLDGVDYIRLNIKDVISFLK